MRRYLNISGDTRSVMELMNRVKPVTETNATMPIAGADFSPEPSKTEKIAVCRNDCPMADWDKVLDICRNGDAAKQFKVGQMLPLYSPVWGFIEWEIVRMEKDGFFVIARHPVASMPFDAEELSKVKDEANKGRRADWGSNDPRHCVPHKFLNSAAGVGNWWKQTTPFDQPPEEAEKLPGFMSALPEEFLKCVRETEVEMEIPECDGGGEQVEKMKFFLPSRQELFADSGETPFFQLASLKKCGCVYWLRSPLVGLSYNVYYVYASGALSAHLAYGTLGVVPACRIG